MMKSIKKNNANKTMSKNMIIGIECFMEDVADKFFNVKSYELKENK